MNYLVVQLSKNGAIEIVENYVDQVLAYKAANVAGRQVWEIANVHTTRQQINRHNAVINKLKPAAPAAPARVLQPHEVWDWKRVTATNKENILAHYNAGQWGEIMKIHNELQLTGEVYCCSYYTEKIKLNIGMAQNNGTI